MKFLPLFLLLFFILLTHAQRRTTAKPSTDPETPKPASRGRGRSRFVSPDTKLTESSSTTEPSSRKTIVSRRRVVENVEQKFPSRASIVSSTPKVIPVNRKTASIGETADKIFLNDNIDRKLLRPANNLNSPLTESVGRKVSTPVTQTERKNFRTLNKRPKNTYEVEEVINDDVDPFKRSKKPRVLTESNFRASKRTSDNAEFSDSSSKNLVAAEPSLSPLNSLANSNLVEEQQLDTTLNPELESSIDALTEVGVREEVQKTVPVSSTTEAPRPQGNRRVGLRRVVNRVPEQATPVTAAPTRIRTRNRATQAPDFYFQAVSTSVPSSSFRRRVDSLFSSIEPKKGPSVFNADAATSESRSRTGRKIELPPEKITLNIPTRSRRVTTTPKSVKTNSVPTFRSRASRFRSREMPVIDEQKLEVLPLFEEEPKLVPTRSSRRNDNLDTRTRGGNKADIIRSRDESLKSTTNRADIDSRSRNRVSFREKQTEDVDLKARRRGALADNIETSATETDMKITKPNEISVSVNVETRTEPLKHLHKTVKESVTSEINEVTSRRKVPRKKVTIINQTKRKVVPVFRGTKKSEVKLEKKQSSEEIGDSDNYPAEFKALLKAAKSDRKESRASLPSSSTLSSAINVVTSSTPSTTANVLTTRQINDNDNEIKSKSSTPSPTTSRWTRSRYTPSTSTQSISEVSTTRRQFVRSTTSATPTSRETKHYLTFPSRSNNSIPRVEKNVSFKPRTFSNENEVRRFGRGRSTKRPLDSTSFSTKVPKYSSTVKKIDRGKYRSGSTTNAPKYIPTIPSAPYIPTVPIVTSHRSGVGASTYQKDDDLGLQVISIDEPVYAIPSANLVNGDYNFSTANSVSVPLPLVNGGTTEKPVSIIERIINSITARSTTSPLTNTQITKITESTTESPSAILKLSQKKTRQTDKTDDTRQQTNLLDTVTLTTENPTTIIEKILSSLNAIQATDNTGSIQDEQNTIPSDTKPLSIAVSTTPSIPPKISKASSTAQSSSIPVTTPTVTSSSKPDTMPTSSRPMSTILTSGRTVETSTDITSTITPNVNDASTTLSDMVTVASTTLGGNNNPTFPTLSELLNGNTLEAFNEIVNKTDNVNFDTPKSEEVKVKKYTQVLNIQDLIKSRNQDPFFKRRSNPDKVDSTTVGPGILSTLNSSPTQSTTTENPSSKIETTTQDPAFLSNRILDDKSTSAPTTRPTKGRRLTSTPAIPTSTYFPTFLSTLFPNLFETTRSPIKSTRAPDGVIRISAAPSVTETISFAASTSSPTTIRLTKPAPRTTIMSSSPITTTAKRVTTRPTTTTARSTTRRSTARRTTTTVAPTTTTIRRTTAAARRTTTTTSTPATTTTIRRTTAVPRIITTTTPPTTLETVTAASTTQKSITVTDFNTVEVTTPLKLKELTNEQRENLKMIARLEKEQAQLFQQLSFLTNLGLGANKATKPLNTANRNPKGPSKTLAERIVALAVERDKETTIESTIPTTTFRVPKSIQDQLAAIETTRQPKKATSLEDVLKQYNLNGLNIVTTPTNPTSKSEDAILNSLLKEQGIVPSTPKSLSGLFQETTIRPRPRARTTTPQPGPLMRGLNWLLTALGPQPQPVPTRRPTPKPVKPKKPPVDQELLANSPTHVTPVVTPAPSKVANAISQDDIQKLIKQLEGIQRNPSKESLDLSKIKSIQNLINLDEGVVVMTNGEHGTTSRRTSTLPTTSGEPTQRQPRKLSTDPPLIVSVNSVEDFELESTTTRVLRAPIGFRPVPGVDDNADSLVRSNLITAAVNVTRAISGFLGTALQGAASSFSNLFGGGSALGTRLLGNAAVGSSAG